MDKKILVTCSSMPDFDEYVNEIRDIWDSHWMTNMGTKHQQLIEELKNYLKVEELQLFVNGHMSLEMSLQALNLKGEVITTPFTFASTTHAIVRNNLKPVFCDINLRDFTIDVDQIERLITDRTCAIVPVHVYGNVCDVERIDEIAKKHHLKVIYDAAHCFGETYKGKGIGSFGDISIFSFHATKVYNTIEGGAATFNGRELWKKLYLLKNFGIVNEHVFAPGANAKMNEFQAAMGLCNLRHVDEEILRRKSVHERYIANLSGIDGLGLPVVQKDVRRNYAYFPVIFDEETLGIDRNQIYDVLAEHDVFARKYFYPIVNDFECYRNEYDSADTPNAKLISLRVLTLPMYADLELSEVDRICGYIRDAIASGNN